MNGKIWLLFISICIALFSWCGGGSDVGNPDIRGRIVDASGTSVTNCMVVLGPRSGNPGKIDSISLGTIVIEVQSMPFETVFTGSNGIFFFDEVPPGEYSVMASKENLFGICMLDHEQFFNSDTIVSIDFPAKLCIDHYSQLMDTLPNAFLAARISGTTITNDVAVTEQILLSSAPAGLVDVILYRKNNTQEYIRGYRFYAACSVTVRVDPSRNQESWTFMTDTHREYNGRPYVLNSSPVDGAIGPNASINKEKRYDVEIQFSHGMDTKKTSAALQAFSDDNRVKIDSIWWQGADVMRIDLCSSDNSTSCLNDSLYLKKGIQYSIAIDTTAQTNLGFRVAWPETLSFVPVP